VYLDNFAYRPTVVEHLNSMWVSPCYQGFINIYHCNTGTVTATRRKEWTSSTISVEAVLHRSPFYSAPISKSRIVACTVAVVASLYYRVSKSTLKRSTSPYYRTFLVLMTALGIALLILLWVGTCKG
jgi:hypothetical protein